MHTRHWAAWESAQMGISAHPRVLHDPVRVHLCTVWLCNCGRSLAGSCSRSLSLILSSWAGAHQISWLPFIALFLIGITPSEEIAVSHPHLIHSQRDQSKHTPPWGWGEGAKRLAISGKTGNQRSW